MAKGTKGLAKGAHTGRILKATCVVVAVLVVMYAAVAIFGRGARNENENERFGGRAKDQYVVVFLHMKGCIWCDQLKPQWDEFKAMYGSELSGLGVGIEDFDRTNPGAAKYSSGIAGYPTVLLVNMSDGSSATFKGLRTSAGLYAFVRQNTNPVTASQIW